MKIAFVIALGVYLSGLFTILGAVLMLVMLGGAPIRSIPLKGVLTWLFWPVTLPWHVIKTLFKLIFL